MSRIESTQTSGFEMHRLHCGASSVEIFTGIGGATGRLRLEERTHAAADITECSDLLAPAANPTHDPWFRGRILFPFNDRIPFGLYTWKGRRLQLPINSPQDGSALHGLVYRRRFTPLPSQVPTEGEAILRLRTEIDAGEFSGYPFDVELETSYCLSRSSFALEMEARNVGHESAPLAFGWHPYFALGGRIDDYTLLADCSSYVPVDESLLPSGETLPVDGTQFDFREGRLIGDAQLDIGLVAPSDGRLELRSPSGSVELTLSGEAFRYIQLFTHPDRIALAIEPVTAATNSFNLPHLGLQVVEPGEILRGRMTITYSAGRSSLVAS